MQIMRKKELIFNFNTQEFDSTSILSNLRFFQFIDFLRSNKLHSSYLKLIQQIELYSQVRTLCTNKQIIQSYYLFMGCKSIKDTSRRDDNQILLFQSMIESGHNYQLNTQYYLTVKSNKSSYNRSVLSIPKQQVLSEQSSKFYSLILFQRDASSRNSKEAIEKQLHERFYQKLSRIDWNERPQVISGSILQIFNEKCLSSTTQSQQQPDKQNKGKNHESSQIFKQSVKFGIVSTDKSVYIYNPEKMNLFIVKDSKIISESLQDDVKTTQKETSCLSSQKIVKKHAPKVVIWKKNEVDFVFFCSPFTSINRFSVEETWNVFQDHIRIKFSVDRNQIGWKYTLGQIQHTYKQALRKAAGPINSKFITKNQSEQFVEIGVVTIGGF